MSPDPRSSYQVVAHNTATQSSNKIHDDAVAREFGFRGGLVPGVDVWAYLVHPCVEVWGDEFFELGQMSSRFDSPVYDGDTVEASLGADGELVLADSSGQRCAVGTARLRGRDETVEVPEIAHVRPPDDRPAASEETLAAGTTLGTLEFHFRPANAGRYLAGIREADPRYAERAIAHPGWFARLCNTVLWRSVVLGPWIHVATEADHLGLVADGALMQVRAKVRDERERKGHRFVELDVVISAEGRPVFVAHHTAIWRPRGA